MIDTMDPPKQARSIRTREAILDSLETLLADKDFDSISISEIATKAGKSVGAFYTRFRDKEDLLRAAQARYEAERAAMGDWFSPQEFAEMTFEEAVHDIVSRTVATYRDRAGLFRALTDALHRGRLAETPEQRAKMNTLYHSVAGVMLIYRDRIVSDDPERAVRMAFFTLTATCKSFILYPNDSHAASLTMSEADFIRECTRSFIAYLTGGLPR